MLFLIDFTSNNLKIGNQNGLLFLKYNFLAAEHDNARASEACRELTFFRRSHSRLLSLSSVSGAGSLYVVSSMMFRSDEFAGKSSMGIKVWQILQTPCLSHFEVCAGAPSCTKVIAFFELNSFLFVGLSVTCRLVVNGFHFCFLEFL